MKKRLLVGSIFADDGPVDCSWLNLQLKFLSQTTDDFDHVSVVWGQHQNCIGDFRSKILNSPEAKRMSDAHLSGLKKLLEYFRTQNYEHFLFLDCDAFPIQKGWLDKLLLKMEEQPVFYNEEFLHSYGQQYEIAAAVRAENLEQRLHASILFANKLNFLDFEFGALGTDLRGEREKDIYLPTYQFKRRKFAYPLMRSNQFNLHPVACGIYYNMFYHHACGSGREFKTRTQDYWDAEVCEGWTHKLMTEPDQFIGTLTY